MLDKNEMKLAMLNSSETETSGVREPPFKSIRSNCCADTAVCRERNRQFMSGPTTAVQASSAVAASSSPTLQLAHTDDQNHLHHEAKSSLDWLVRKLDERLSSSKPVDLLAINRILENAIHWCLVNGNKPTTF